MKRPIRETERARKVACASRDDEKKRSMVAGSEVLREVGRRVSVAAGVPAVRGRERRARNRDETRGLEGSASRPPRVPRGCRVSRVVRGRLDWRGRLFAGRGTARDRRRWERTARRACRCSWPDSTPGGAPPCRTPPPRRSSGDASRPLTAARGCCVAPPETRHAKSTRVVSESAT